MVVVALEAGCDAAGLSAGGLERERAGRGPDALLWLWLVAIHRLLDWRGTWPCYGRPVQPLVAWNKKVVLTRARQRLAAKWPGLAADRLRQSLAL